jgi:uncharacterized protein (DUF952 family)
MSAVILHIASRSDWTAAQAGAAYTADSLHTQGFIHCSTAGQAVRTANAYFPGRRDLVLLVIDPDRLKAEIRWEPGTDLPEQLFPHIYGPLNLDAVVRVLDFPPGPDGAFVLPASLVAAGG